MTARLNIAALNGLPAYIRKPCYDHLSLRCGLVHLGISAFHRAHQAAFTDDAIEIAGGDWGILGASLRHADVPEALAAQNGLFTIETLAEQASYRVVGAIKRVLFAPANTSDLLAAIASPATHAVMLTLTEAGYCLDARGELNLFSRDIAADLVSAGTPRSAIGWLVRGLALREGGPPLTVIACDNLQANGEKLERAVLAFAERSQPALRKWIADHVTFPKTLVDCIVPASSEAHRARVEEVIGVRDTASVQREEFSQWVIENRFAGPIPAWQRAGVEIVENIEPYERQKLHVLNACHSALAYLGLPRGHVFVRQAIADAELADFLDRLVEVEIAPALAPLPVRDYWRNVRARFANPMVDHRLSQISEDGSLKLRQRIFPLLIEGARAGRRIDALGSVVRAWLDFMAKTPSRDPQTAWFADWAQAGADKAVALYNLALFPPAFRSDARLRASILATKRAQDLA
jgi:fructuronate reductase